MADTSLLKALFANTALDVESAVSVIPNTNGQESGQPIKKIDKRGESIDQLDTVDILSNVNPPKVHVYGEFGQLYQCVEFVNRYYVQQLKWRNMKGEGDAKDYIKLKGMDTYRSGQTEVPPQHGDILVTSIKGLSGHVAIAGEVNILDNEAIVQVKQQNVPKYSTYYTTMKKENGVWTGGRFWLDGYEIEAWVRRNMLVVEK